MYKRIIIKLSGEALLNQNANDNFSNHIFHDKVIINIIKDIKKIIKNGTEVSLVIGGGNIWRGRDANYMDRIKADQIGMLATVINSIYIGEHFKNNNINTVVMTPFKIGNMTEEFSKEATLKYMKEGTVVIFAGGIGHPFFSTDTIPALRGAELQADCILFAKSIDGIYNKNPALYKDAIRYKKITYRKIIKDNLIANDITSMVLCENNKIPSLVFSLNYPNSIEIACKNNEEFYKFGTKIVFNEKDDYYAY